MSHLIITQSNRGAPDPIGLHDDEGNLINPATVEKLEELKIVLSSIQTAVENVSIDADSVNLNTDELESKVQSVRDQLDVLLSTRASESTLQSVLTSIGSGAGTNLLTELQSLLSGIGDVASETTLIQIRDYLDTVETKLQSLIDKNIAQETGGNLASIKSNTDKLDVNLSTVATETTLSTVKTDLASLLAKIDVALSTRSSETTLSSIKTDLDNIYSKLDVSLSTRSSESTLQSVLDAIGSGSGTNLLTELQAIVSGVGNATEATLIQVRDYLDTVEIKLQSLIDKNEAQETGGNLSLIKTAIDSILTKLDVALSTRASETTLSSVKTDLDNIYTRIDVALSTRSSETTLSSVKTNLDDVKTKLDTLNSKDFATQTTLALIKTAIDSILTNIDVVLSTRASETTLSSVKTNLDDVKTKLDSLQTELNQKTEPTNQQHVIIDSIPEVEIKNDVGNPIPVSGTVTVDTSLLATENTLNLKTEDLYLVLDKILTQLKIVTLHLEVLSDNKIDKKDICH